VYVVGNKVRSERDRQFIQGSLPEDKILGFLPFSEKAIEADMAGVAVFDMDSQLVTAARQIRDRLPVR
jgi:CO dehydrogenase maturation factor